MRIGCCWLGQPSITAWLPQLVATMIDWSPGAWKPANLACGSLIIVGHSGTPVVQLFDTFFLTLCSRTIL